MPGNVYLVDAHCHLHEYSIEEINALTLSNNIVIVAVGDDLETSNRVIEIAKTKSNILPCVGLHPWHVKSREEGLNTAKKIIELALENNIKCIGEVGLDTKFVAETIELQREIFKLFLEAARDNKLVLNLHTAGTWEEVYQLLVRYDIERAMFHWYTGPLYLLKDIEASEYMISINPAVKIQRKHKAVVENAPITIMLTESDGPYEYRGMKLNPLMVREVVGIIASIKNVDQHLVQRQIIHNLEKLFGAIINYI